jgi:hypothetical protein
MTDTEIVRRLFMPIPIAVYKFGSKAMDELASGAQALLNFYSVIAVVLLLVLLLEAHFGMFDDLSISQAWLRATGTEVIPDQFVSLL